MASKSKGRGSKAPSETPVIEPQESAVEVPEEVVLPEPIAEMPVIETEIMAQEDSAPLKQPKFCKCHGYRFDYEKHYRAHVGS